MFRRIKLYFHRRKIEKQRRRIEKTARRNVQKMNDAVTLAAETLNAYAREMNKAQIEGWNENDET